MNTQQTAFSPTSSSSTSSVLGCITELNNIEINRQKEVQRQQEEERLALAKKLREEEEAKREQERLAALQAKIEQAKDQAREDEERRKQEEAIQRAIEEVQAAVHQEFVEKASQNQPVVAVSPAVAPKRSWALGASALLLSLCSLALVLSSGVGRDEGPSLIVKRPVIVLETIEKTQVVAAAENKTADPVVAAKATTSKTTSKPVETNKTTKTASTTKKTNDEACKRDPLCNLGASGVIF